MISVENLSKSYGGQVLFDGISFRINARERVGIVGRNGHGKTTLLKIITRKTHPDSGSVIIPKNYHIGYVRQQIKFTENTVLTEGMKGLSRAEKDHHWKVEKVLFGLGFSEADMQRHPGEFSGGFQVRLNLAKILVADPDLLLLDEPTNYLDITSIRWIIHFLKSWPRELMLVTHDRNFMDSIVTHTIGIHRKKIRKIAGNTENYYSQIAQDEKIYEKTRINDEKRRREIELFISRFRAKARLANLVQSRVKTLAKTEKLGKLEILKTLGFSFRSKPFVGKQVISTQKLTFFYDKKKPLIENFNLIVNAGERICIIGKNGKGKTTLLKLLAGRISPQSGKIICNPNTAQGVFEQTNIKSLVDAHTIEEEIIYSNKDVDRQTARNICGAMMFSGDNALKKISVLSGGEKSRVMLGKLMVTPVNLLLLDEPTNHLDMDACDALLAAIDNFNGTVIMVTHNEMFLHALADKLVVFKDNCLEVFNGGYQRFLEKGGWEDQVCTRKPEQNKNAVQNQTGHLNRKDLRKKRSEIITIKGKILKPIEVRMSKVEEKIEYNAKEIEQINKNLILVSSSGNGVKIAELSRELHDRQIALDALFDELEILTTAFEKNQAQFQKQLADLEI